MSTIQQGMRAARWGLFANIGLVLLKLVTGLLGSSYALVADAIESSTDVFSSLIVWRGLQITGKPPDEEFRYGYGKAESIATAVVSLMLIAAAIFIAVVAVREIITPHHAPAPFTLIVLGPVILVKEFLFRRVLEVGHETGSTAVMADAWHHRSDALTSAAAFIGITVAVWGGAGWESADDWAAMVASLIMTANGIRMMRVAVNDLMDRVPETDLVERIAQAALTTRGVLAIEKLRVRKLGLKYSVDVHVQADPTLSLRDAHVLSGKVKGNVRAQVPAVDEVLVHMEPFEEEPAPTATRAVNA
ncbi:MAG TPA: cation diffusion facilitator family transporter [Planctomycetaceae bacterium]|jgi:cation diffusion facilitator family transporter|nr:cation diffusion facilitator family transporter [Planctomycetaceae bacterium]